MSSSSANLLMKYYRELTDPKKAIPSFHITVSRNESERPEFSSRHPVCVSGTTAGVCVRTTAGVWWGLRDGTRWRRLYWPTVSLTEAARTSR